MPQIICVITATITEERSPAPTPRKRELDSLRRRQEGQGSQEGTESPDLGERTLPSQEERRQVLLGPENGKDAPTWRAQVPERRP